MTTNATTTREIARRARRAARPAKHLARRAVPGMVARKKYRAELDYWRGELENLEKWFVDRSIDWWGFPPPPADRRQTSSTIWSVNAVHTLHALRPTYHEELRLGEHDLAGARVLEVGCGPLAPILQFAGCERHGIDPLLNQYMQAGWPLFAYDATLVHTAVESMPYPDGYFDAVISVNALDHVDDFALAAAEIERVLRPGGRLAVEIEYHEPTVTEPLSLDDEQVLAAFSRCDMTIAAQRDGVELHEALSERYSLVTTKFGDLHGADALFTAWHGVRR